MTSFVGLLLHESGGASLQTGIASVISQDSPGRLPHLDRPPGDLLRVGLALRANAT